MKFTQLELDLFPEKNSWMWKDVEPIFDDIVMERHRQISKWGLFQNHPHGTGLNYFIGAATETKRINSQKAQQGILTWVDILEEECLEAFAETDPVLLRAELIQCAAVIFAWIEQLDGYPRWEPARQ